MRDLQRVAVRRAHAEAELIARGVLKGGGFPPGLRLIQWMMPWLKSPYYGDHATYGLVMGGLFGLPMGGFCALVVAQGNAPPGAGWWAFLGLGVLSGLMFGGGMAFFMRRTHRQMRLTPWEALDRPAGAPPDGAASFARIEAEASTVGAVMMTVLRMFRR